MLAFMSAVSTLHRQFEQAWMSKALEKLLPLAQEQLQEAQRQYPDDHPVRITALLDLARAKHAHQAIADSQALEAEATAMRLRLMEYSEKNPSTELAGDFWFFEGTRLEIEEPQGAQHFLRKAANIFRADSRWRIKLAETLTAWSEVELIVGDLPAAERLSREAHRTFEDADQSNELGRLRAQECLARALNEQGRYAEAMPLFQEALEWPERESLDKHSFYFLLIHQADCLSHLGREPEAEVLRQKAASILPQANPGVFGFQI